ncbi:MAG: D-alanyl-D-alanine carboxypeptidase family protein [Candidatus Caenarcaniphilales bacterium]|nr:D-alanyl-D-alanine carboxypeptidase family protein [Candidatus Caenarcaniphilales bacterium]
MDLSKQSLYFLMCIWLILSFGPSIHSENRGLEKEKALFFQSVQGRLDSIPSPKEEIHYRILKEYGALWTGSDPEVKFPPKLIFESEADTLSYQENLQLDSVSGNNCRLQKAALSQLNKAQSEAAALKLKITPRGSDSCLRSYKTTYDLWLSRLEPNLNYYVSNKKLTQAEAQKVRKAPLNKQIKMVLDLETQKGLLFDKYRQTSILNSVAAPGSSQHLSGLAFDVAEFANPQIRKILNKHGWYQTVENDQPHFTYLGVQNNEENLKNYGLVKKAKGQFSFWIPNI